MNKKAEVFKKFLNEKKIACFYVDEVTNDKLETVVFRSKLDINGQQLPTLLILDNSIYAMIRILLAPKAVTADNKTSVSEFLNALNRKYKSFKYYFDEEGNLALDCCLVCNGDEITGELIYTMFDVTVKNLNDEYKNIMKTIWQ